MKHNEIMAAIQQLKNTVANVQCQIAVLEGLLHKEGNENPVEETPVINESKEELPAPPAEVRIDTEEKDSHEKCDEECILGCKILTELGEDFYNGRCSVLRLHKQYFDNGQPKLYINKYKVVIIALDCRMKELGRTITHWDNLSKFHTELIERGINTHSGDNWMPKIINLDLD